MFKNFNYNNSELIHEVKKVIADSKNDTPFNTKTLSENDMICLIINSNLCDNHWGEFPYQIDEMFSHRGLGEKYRDEIGIYVKTKNNIPIKAVIKTR